MGRKILRDGGAEIKKLLGEITQTAIELEQCSQSSAKHLGGALNQAVEALGQAVDWVIQNAKAEPAGTHLGSLPLVKLAGCVFRGWMMGRDALPSEQALEEARAFTGDK